MGSHPGLEYFCKAMLNQILHLLQQHGFIVEGSCIIKMKNTPMKTQVC